MRKLSLFISFILFTLFTSAQIYDPVTWDFTYEKKGEKQDELIFTANIEKNSHIYSMDIPSGGLSLHLSGSIHCQVTGLMVRPLK